MVAGAGRTIYVSGQGALDETGKLVGRGDVAAQTRKTLDNNDRMLVPGDWTSSVSAT